MNSCPTCNALGYIRSVSTVSFDILKNLQAEVVRKNLKGTITITVSPAIFDYLIHREFQSLLTLETKLHCKIILESNEKFDPHHFVVGKA